MLGSFKHKGLRKLFESGNTAGVDARQVDRLRKILALLATADSIEDMSLPGLNLHELKGARKGTWSVKVSGNWRITFRFEKGDVIDVDYEDYH
jgi:proteic killer suppression protein